MSTAAIADLVAAMVPVVLPLSKYFVQNLAKVDQVKRDYELKIESATGDDVFKYLLLINISALESYVTQTRLQAEQSFRLSRIVAIVGFTLVAVGIAVGIFSQLFLQHGLEVAYLASIAGILTQFISGVFFYLYNKTLQQINLFYSELQSSQKAATSLLLASLVTDEKQRDATKIDLAKLIISSSRSNPVHQ